MDRSILFLEDDSTVRRPVALALRGAGWSVIDTGDPMVAIGVLERNVPVDVLLTDLIMRPQKPHGLSIAKMAMIKRPDLKVVYLTGFPEKLPEKEIECGKTVLLAKPVRIDLLLETIERLVLEESLVTT
jgi:two-component system, cell cycle response regulator CpdR